MEEKDGKYMFKVNWKSLEGVDDWTHFYFNKDNLQLVLFEHYFKGEKEDPWVAFDVLEPITQKDLSDSDFAYAPCSKPDDAIKIDM